MAQALFDEHPLGVYLRDNGEMPLLIPGTYPTLEHELGDFDARDHSEWLPSGLFNFIEFLLTTIISAQADIPSPFVEKFKYNVISSSLLSPALSTLYSRRSSGSLSVPGKLVHSRASSMDLNRGIPKNSVPLSEPSYEMISLSTASVVVLFTTGYPFLTLIAVLVTLLLVYNFCSMTDSHQSDMTASLRALNDLIQANQTWHSVVQDAVIMLENEERISFLDPPNTPLTPHTHIHVQVALHSCLQTTQTQCDSIRSIFSALTSPAELSQLSEMYAPHSPSKASFNYDSISHFSFPPSPLKSLYTSPDRATWSCSPTSPTSIHRSRHRARLPDLFDSSTSSTPISPCTISSQDSIPDISNHSSAEGETSLASSGSNSFGVAALKLQRKRKSGALTFRTSSPRGARNVMSPVTPTSSASSFTSLQLARHPLSLSALTYAVQGAIAAKRYASSHLLALRFSDEEDEGYWEDVRSVIGLLISTLADASSRLSEALDEAEQQNLQDQIPRCQSSEDETTFRDLKNQNPSYKLPHSDARVSFAPMPSHMSRFAAHVATITSALDDARDNLEECTSALKESSASSSTFSGSSQRSPRSKNIPKSAEAGGPAAGEAEVPAALQAYERLRRELGLALRECERGRDRLLEIVLPPSPSDEEEVDDLPSLGHDLSDDSDKTDSITHSLDEESDVAVLVNAGKAPAVMVDVEVGGDLGGIDDATSHLLQTATTKHLPMPGIEEVFEAEMGSKVVFSRERSKLTRKERIKAVKARREGRVEWGIAFRDSIGGNGDGGVESQKMRGIEKWGPGGEVVQELKDVIWKVSEKRRKIAVASQAVPQPS